MIIRMLPDMDGYEVCRRPKIRTDVGAVPVIFMMVLSETSDKVKGFEALSHIRKLPEFDQMCVIAVSASVLEQAREQSLAAGCDDYLSKPFTIEELFACLQKYLGIVWRYADTGPHTPKPVSYNEESEIIPPPHEVLVQLLNLSMMGDVMNIEVYAQQLLAQPEYTAFAQKVSYFASGFMIDEIQEFLQQYVENVG